MDADPTAAPSSLRARATFLRRLHDPGPAPHGDAGEAHLWHIGTALAVSFTVAVAGLAGLAGLAWVLLGLAGYRHHGAPALSDTVSVLQLVFATVAGAGALVALIVAYRRQKIAEADSVHDRTRVFNERFTSIAAQLGGAQPAVRLAGVHAMAGLADDWKQNRQTCVDVLCAYLRLPSGPEPDDDANSAERTSYWADREVRQTIIRLISAHLRSGASVSWQGLNFDFTGVVFDGGDFSSARFSSAIVLFTGAEFVGGQVSFDDAEFTGSRVYFDGAKFNGSQVTLHCAKFTDGQVYFNGAEFSDGTIVFNDAKFTGARVYFEAAEFCGGTVSYARTEFRGGKVYFNGAEFSDGMVSFNDAKFTGGVVNFNDAEFTGGTVSYVRAEFISGEVSYFDAKFTDGQVNFDRAEFTGGTVYFNGSRFHGGQVTFSGADFSNGLVDLSDAEFTGGTVNFHEAGRWSFPPVFSWDGRPPAGMLLPDERMPPLHTSTPGSEEHSQLRE